MAITECGKGHVYDTEQYAVCPYCNGGGNMIRFDGGQPSGAGNRTVAPGMMAGTAGTPGNANSDKCGKTVAPESYRRQLDNENKTVGVFRKEYEYEPVVGWLVCVEGVQKGKDFRLLARINTIGRSESNDVCIKNDDTISKENHARLAYDPKHNHFQLIPGDSVNSIYVNDEPVYIPVRLSQYDMIELGNSKLIFVPFCGEHFRWATGLIQQEE